MKPLLAAPAVITTALAAAGVSAIPAEAQFGYETRNNVSVRERPRPGYEADGVQVGGLLATPVFSLRGRYDDNIYAADDDPDDPTAIVLGVEEDFILTAGFDNTLETTWPIHRIALDSSVAYQQFTNNDDESQLNADVGLSGRYDITRRASLDARVSGTRRHEFRQSANSVQTAVEPIEIDVLAAELSGEQSFDQLRLSAAFDYRDFTHGQGVTLDGDVVDQGNRDRNEMSLAGRADYAISPDSALFVQVGGNEIDYDNGQVNAGLVLDRSSTGFDALVGASFDITNLMRGEIAAGYLSQEFDTPSVTGDDSLDGIDMSVNVDWFLTPLTTVNFGAARDIGESSFATSAGFLSTSGTVAIDHELLVNVILSGQLDFRKDDYQGLDRTDDRYGVALGATYLMNDRIGMDVQLSRTQQQSYGLDGGRDFDINAVEAVLRFAL